MRSRGNEDSYKERKGKITALKQAHKYKGAILLRFYLHTSELPLVLFFSYSNFQKSLPLWEGKVPRHEADEVVNSGVFVFLISKTILKIS